MKYLILFLFNILSVGVFAQTTGTDSSETAEEALLFAEVMPEFPGGDNALYMFIQKNVQYPPKARESGIQGKVLVQFVVEKNGRISNIKTLGTPDPLLAAEAIRVVKLLPPFKPGMLNGKPVRVQYNLPVRFVLSN